MSFEIREKQSVRKNIRRILRKQVESAEAELSGKTGDGRDAVVHEARKCFKRIRAVLRLIRPAIDERVSRAENTRFRDAARPLTEVRDAKILVESFEALLAHFQKHIAGRGFQAMRWRLEENLRATRQRVLEEQNALAEALENLGLPRERLTEVLDVPNRWSALGPGLEETYRQARSAFETASADPSIENLHECRKQAKYLRYQLEILTPIWQDRLREIAGEADHMSDLLGDDHDLAMLRQMIADVKDADDDGDRETLEALVDRRRSELEQDAYALGRQFFQEKPRAFARRLKRQWKIWRGAAMSLH